MLEIHEIIFIIYRSYRNEIEFIRFVNNSKIIFKSSWVVKIVSIFSQLMSVNQPQFMSLNQMKKAFFVNSIGTFAVISAIMSLQ